MVRGGGGAGSEGGGKVGRYTNIVVVTFSLSLSFFLSLSLSLSLSPPLPLPHSHKHTPCQALTNRLKGYHDQTVPIVEHYRPKGIVNTLNGDQKPAEVSAALATLLEGAFPA